MAISGCTSSNIKIEANPNVKEAEQTLSQFDDVEWPNCEKYFSVDECIIDFAGQQKNPKPCLKLVSTKSHILCKTNVAVELNNKDICKLEASSEGRKYCENVLDKKIDFCSEQSDANKRVYCYSFIAKAQKDASICDVFGEEDYGQTMKNICLLEVAKSTLDKTICDKITNLGTYHDRCLEVTNA